MRSMKSVGGLTCGRGIGEAQRSRWILSMPACSALNIAMQELTGASYVTSDQHTDMSIARQQRGEKDKLTVLGFLRARNPFVEGSKLQNIATDDAVNADRARAVGDKILETLRGKNALDHTYRKKDNVVNMANKVSTKIEGSAVHVDPQLLFQRLILAAGRDI